LPDTWLSDLAVPGSQKAVYVFRTISPQKKGGKRVARILVVEDELALRRVITLNLVRRGYTVAEADSVLTANDACQASPEPFDLILLDINLPDQTGWDVLRYLEKCGPPVTGSAESAAKTSSEISPQSLQSGPRVIVITAVRPQQSRLDEFQPEAVLLKPFPIAALLQLIERVLGNVPAEQSSADDEAEPAGESSEMHHTGA
jgi:CheY-like chemotaxis protein